MRVKSKVLRHCEVRSNPELGNIVRHCEVRSNPELGNKILDCFTVRSSQFAMTRYPLPPKGEFGNCGIFLSNYNPKLETRNNQQDNNSGLLRSARNDVTRNPKPETEN